MKNGYVKSNPYFFRRITWSLAACCLLLVLAATICPAPLQEAANPAVTPNPAKSAWFLLWIQELVSWSRLMIYPVLVGALLFLLLPWLPAGSASHTARWFPRERWLISTCTLLGGLLILLLTIVALLFRGAHWALLW